MYIPLQFEEREETLKLRAKLEAADYARASGAPRYTIEESKRRLEARTEKEKVKNRLPL